MSTRDKTIYQILKKALKTPVTPKIAKEINEVLNTGQQSFTAAQALALAQLAKAVKGDKNSFETLADVMENQNGKETNGFKVEIKVVE